ncbi:MAG: penicillin-binding protein 2 [bacterium]
MSINSPENRIRIVFSGVILIALILVTRLYFLQVVHGKEYSDRADRQYVKSYSQIFDRGSINFSNKDGTVISAATLSNGYTVSLNPKKITDQKSLYDKLSLVVSITPEDYYAKVSKVNSSYEKIAERIDRTTADKITALKLDGVEVQKQNWRYYPSKNIASRVIGFVGFDGDTFDGRYGLEKYYNDILARNQNGMYVNFFAELFSNINKAISSDDNNEGDIVTTIEPTVESYLESKIADVQKKYESNITGGIIMDPQTGEITAMAVNPNFDPNNYNLEKDVSVYNNPLVEGVYEMGSIIKPLTVAAALDTGAVTAETTYNDTGCWTLDKSTICNFDGKARGVVPVQQVLSQSLNVGSAHVALLMGKDNFATYMRNYGLDVETGIDLPSENHGRLNNLTSPRDIEYATAAFGQGISMTPIETIRALASLGNGGKLVKPHLVKKIEYKNGLFNNISYENEATQVLKKETSTEISRMLTEVVDKALMNGTIKLEHYSVAAKTGTAQIAKPGGGYYDDKWLHSFFGYFPSYKPKFIIFLYTVEPKGVNYASQTLTQPFADLVKFLINYYEIAPDR